jgi:hypothetical protein
MTALAESSELGSPYRIARNVLVVGVRDVEFGAVADAAGEFELGRYEVECPVVPFVPVGGDWVGFDELGWRLWEIAAEISRYISK